MKNLKYFLLLVVAMVAGTLIIGCSSDDYMGEAQQQGISPTTRGVSDKMPKLTTYIETNDVNPLNAGEYYFTGTDPQEQVIDNVILFAHCE